MLPGGGARWAFGCEGDLLRSGGVRSSAARSAKGARSTATVGASGIGREDRTGAAWCAGVVDGHAERWRRTTGTARHASPALAPCGAP